MYPRASLLEARIFRESVSLIPEDSSFDQEMRFLNIPDLWIFPVRNWKSYQIQHQYDLFFLPFVLARYYNEVHCMTLSLYIHVL